MSADPERSRTSSSRLSFARPLKWVASAASLLTCTMLVHPALADSACSSLTSLSVPDVTITSATAEAPGFVPTGSPTVAQAFCRVVAVATPTGSSGINFEVWLPVAGAWNHKFRAEGSGGSAGALSYAAMVDALSRNYATMSQDNGHTGSSWTFSENPYSVIDFGYRAEHVTTVAAKAIVTAYYSIAPVHSYYLGCSQGGHHGQMEVQRYPDDFDGIIAGSAAMDWTGLMVDEVWTGYSSSVAGPQFDLPQTQLNLVTAAVVAKCGTQVFGLASNGFLNDPRACHFDPAVLQCTDGQDPSTCLTGQQVSAVQKIYEGPRDPITFRQIGAPLVRGSETAWRQFPLILPERRVRRSQLQLPELQFPFRRSRDAEQDVCRADAAAHPRCGGPGSGAVPKKGRQADHVSRLGGSVRLAARIDRPVPERRGRPGASS